MDDKRCSLIFFAFAGMNQPINLNPFEMDKNFEFWHLKGMILNQFVEAIKIRIPPVNENVLKNYESAPGVSLGPWSISHVYFAKATWGILLPAKDPLSAFGSEFVLNLFAKRFLYPLFVVNDMGIQPKNPGKNHLAMMDSQTQQGSFLSNDFPSFFRAFQHAQGYAALETSEMKKWDKEDWRFATASTLFDGLKAYDDGKSMIGWQRESADIATTLECLLTAEDDTNSEVGYRLRKRAAVLINRWFPDVEKDLKKLYDQRSSFVHGSFFADLVKKSKESGPDSFLPFPDGRSFGLLRLQTTQLRFIFVACLILSEEIKKGSIPGPRVLDLLEDSIINIETRKKVHTLIDPILDKLPN